MYDLPLVGLQSTLEETSPVQEGVHKEETVFGFATFLDEWGLTLVIYDMLKFLDKEIFLPLNEKPGLVGACPLPRPADKGPPGKGRFDPIGGNLGLNEDDADGLTPVKTDSDFLMAFVSLMSLDSKSSPNRNLLDGVFRSLDWFLRISLTLGDVSIRVVRMFSLR